MHGAVVAPCFFDITNLAVLLDFLNEYEVQRVYLMGGEPLLHPDFNLIYSVLYDNGFQVALTTNGSLISDQLLSYLNRNLLQFCGLVFMVFQKLSI